MILVLYMLLFYDTSRNDDSRILLYCSMVRAGAMILVVYAILFYDTSRSDDSCITFHCSI